MPYKKDIPAQLLTPEAIAVQNSQIAAAVKEALAHQESQAANAVKEAIAATVAALMPAIERLSQLTPLEREEQENLARLKERFKREKAAMMAGDEEPRQYKSRSQRACRHRDKNEKSCIALMHCGFPDSAVRGMCLHCHLLIEPKHYVVANPGIVTMEDAQKFIQYIERTEGLQGITAYFDQKLRKVTHFLYIAHQLYTKVLELEIASTAGN